MAAASPPSCAPLAAPIRKPEWLKVRAPGGAAYTALKERVRRLGLHTVCEEAQCPNIGECWGGGTATLMLMGDVCTRGCRFCAVSHGRPPALDPAEPENAAEATVAAGFDYVVLTSVNRDDLPDGGAAHFAATIRAIKRRAPALLVECLIPDFMGDAAALATVVAARPDVLAHNVETTRALTPAVRDARTDYDQSLAVLRRARETAAARGQRMLTKSSLMLGLGEPEADVLQAMRDLRAAGCDVLTLGQYLRPSLKHLPVVEYVHPDRFAALQRTAVGELGFRYVAAGPLVRSSYRAGEYFIASMLRA
ncbi:MAG TPA: lipoyl synthase [Myxococcota bacterium]|jgi:lipoic acid synthetase|nr:lipoyl synthase [Myxococcota bacterium]